MSIIRVSKNSTPYLNGAVRKHALGIRYFMVTVSMKRLVLGITLTLCALYQIARHRWLVRRGKKFYYIKLT